MEAPAADVFRSTIPAVFLAQVDERPTATALRYKKYGLWHAVTWQTYAENARALAHTLRQLGLQTGDRVAILGDNGPEWVYADLGVQLAGGISVGIYATSSAKQCAYILQHAETKFCFIENEEQLDKWLTIRDEVPSVENVIVWDWEGLRGFSDPQVLDFEKCITEGKSADEAHPEQISAWTSTVQPDDVSVLIYTSGTTGPPKGAMLTHANVTWMGDVLGRIGGGMDLYATDEVMSFLPLCHIFERMFSVLVHIRHGYVVNFVESLDTIADNLREISPTVGYAVPRIWEKYASMITLKMAEATWFKRVMFQGAVHYGRRYAQRQLDGGPISVWHRGMYALAYGAVFRKLKKRLGFDRMRYALSGAAPISPDVLLFFRALGLELIEGYGQTETSGVTTGVRGDKVKLGTVGIAVQGVTVKLAEDGEILVRSPGVFKGYYKNPEATTAALQADWLHSGDIGAMDAEGFLRIVDRKKDLIITAGGKNIAPQYLENKLKFSPYINDAVVIGDRRKFLSAIIVLDEDNIVKYAQDHKVQYTTYADLADNPAINLLIKEEVAGVNKQVARVEQVRKFRILPKRLYEEDGEVTPTMKVKRAFINRAYTDLIEEMYV